MHACFGWRQRRRRRKIMRLRDSIDPSADQRRLIKRLHVSFTIALWTKSSCDIESLPPAAVYQMILHEPIQLQEHLWALEGKWNSLCWFYWFCSLPHNVRTRKKMENVLHVISTLHARSIPFRGNSNLWTLLTFRIQLLFLNISRLKTKANTRKTLA